MVDQQVKSSLLPFDAGEALKAKTTKEAGLRVSTGVHWSKSREKRFSSIKNLIAINLQAHVLGSIKTLNVRDCLLALAFCWLSINTLFMAGEDWLAPRNGGLRIWVSVILSVLCAYQMLDRFSASLEKQVGQGNWLTKCLENLWEFWPNQNRWSPSKKWPESSGSALNSRLGGWGTLQCTVQNSKE